MLRDSHWQLWTGYRKPFLVLCFVTILMMTMFTERRPQPPPGYPCSTNESYISGPIEHNMAIIDSYRFANIEKYVDQLGLRDKIEPVARDVPVIATGSSSNHFQESLQMLNNLKSKLFDSYKDIRVYYYDMGLTSKQREKIKQFPRVHLRTFPFSDYPDHVSILKGYAWKPIIIQLVLRQFGFVMWMDASARLIYPNINELSRIAKENGIAFRSANSSMISLTDIDTFKFLNENPCNFKNYGEIEANVILVYRTQFVNDYIMKPVVSCALTLGCLITRNSAAIRVCPDIRQDHGCHRFDQSVFAIVLRRLFQNDPRYWISRESGIYICRGPEKFSRFFPHVLNDLIASVKLFFDETNHARCRKGTKWYKPEEGIDH